MAAPRPSADRGARAAADAAGELPRHRAPGIRSRRGARAPPGDPARRRARALEPGRRRARRRAIRSAGRTSKSCSTPASTSGRRVNVQHLESLNDLVAQITGVKQRETLPDRIFDEADEVELIDLPPDDLLARLHAGKVYVPERGRHGGRAVLPQAEPDRAARARAAAHDASASRPPRARRSPAIARSRDWLARDRLLVAIGPDPQAEQLVRAGKRLADALDARWTVVYVETPALLRLSEQERDRRIDLLRLAESLGAETVTLDGPTAADALHRIRADAPRDARHRRRAEAARLARAVAPLDGDRARARRARASTSSRSRRASGAAPRRRRAACELRDEYAQPIALEALRWRAAAISAVCTAVAFGDVPVLRARESRDGLSARRRRRGPALRPRPVGAGGRAERRLLRLLLRAAAIHVRRVRRAVPGDVRRHAHDRARHRDADGERAPADARRGRARAAHGAAVRDEPRARRDARHRRAWRASPSSTWRRCSSAKRVVLLPDAPASCGYPSEPPIEGSYRGARSRRCAVGRRSRAARGLGLGHAAGRAGALSAARRRARKALGVLAVLPTNPRRVLLPEQRHLLETFAGQIGLALERARLAERRRGARVAAESEKLAQHAARVDLARPAHAARRRWPAPAARSRRTARRSTSATRTRARALDRDEGARDVRARLERARPDALRVGRDRRCARDWETVDDLVGGRARAHRGAARRSSGRRRACRPICRPCSSTRPSSCRCSTTCSTTRRSTRRPARAITSRPRDEGGFVRVIVDDDGPGLAAAAIRERLFDKFQRGISEGTIVGAGLGPRDLPRDRASARRRRSHAGPRPGGGARFEFTLPDDGAAARDAGDAPDPRRRGRCTASATCCACCSTAENYRVVEAERRSAREIEARSHKPDLLLVDLGLPDGDGIDVIRRVRAWSPVPIIVLSARTLRSAEDRGARCRRRRLRDQAFQRRRAARARARRVAPQRARHRAASRRCGSAMPRSISSVGAHADPTATIHLTPLEYRVLEMPRAPRRHDRQAGAAVARGVGSGSCRRYADACASASRTCATSSSPTRGGRGSSSPRPGSAIACDCRDADQQSKEVVSYSWRSARRGFTRLARYAGIDTAASATSASTTGTPDEDARVPRFDAIQKRNRAGRPKDRRRQPDRYADHYHGQVLAANTMPTMRSRRAPSAIRIPRSCVRWANRVRRSSQ